MPTEEEVKAAEATKATEEAEAKVAAETKAAETKATEEAEAKAKEEAEAAKAKNVPSEYEDFSIPEGFKIDTDSLKSFQEFGQKHGLSQEAAQAAVNLHAQAIEEFTSDQQDQWAEVRKGWVKETKADKSLHDSEGKVEAAIATSKKAVLAVGGQALQEALDHTGAGDHPSVVKAFFEIGKRINDDTMVFGGSAIDNRTAADRLYPSMKSSAK